jgi:deoxyribodipyrimidine photo-lyase
MAEDSAPDRRFDRPWVNADVMHIQPWGACDPTCALRRSPDMSAPRTAVVWFRRDLRVHDHPALRHALAEADRVLPLFVVDERILAGRWASPNRLWFLAGALRSLRTALRARGGDLLVVRGDPVRLVPELADRFDAGFVAVSRDRTPYGRARDAAVEAALRERSVELRAGRGLLVHEPEDVRRLDGEPFVVFSPFHRAWLKRDVRPVIPAPETVRTPTLAATGDPDQLLGHPQPTADPRAILEPTESAARERLATWAASEALRDYDAGRDRLDLPGTSRLSQDLRFGLLSPVEVLERCAGRGAGPARFRSQIAWRDFYAHLLWHRPEVARTAFRRELDDVAWQRSPDVIEAWQAGRTGYPVVDAAMRQLLATGWMPNRARMIVASFLTKHLGVDWRVGETWFMRHLLDGDPASNNGGWQWAASSGTDPQPYFRVFNPTLQGRRHDATGGYVRRWVAELRDAPADVDVHEPPPGTYLTPIVDHAAARRTAIAAFSARRSEGPLGHR